MEYQRNRIGVILEQKASYTEIGGAVVTAKQKLESSLRKYSRHPVLKTDELLQRVGSFCDDMVKELDDIASRHPDLLKHDSIRDKVDAVFKARVGTAYSLEQLQNIYLEGQKRYEERIPPGYEDKRDKPEPDCYGDFVLWKQMLQMAAERKSPVIFVTDEKKEDWWWKLADDRLIGPRQELVDEMISDSGVRFYAYRVDQFLSRASDYLKSEVSAESVQEVRQLGELREIDRQLYKSLWTMYAGEQALDDDDVEDMVARAQAVAQGCHMLSDKSALLRSSLSTSLHASDGLDAFRIARIGSLLSHLNGLTERLERTELVSTELLAELRPALRDAVRMRNRLMHQSKSVQETLDWIATRRQEQSALHHLRARLESVETDFSEIQQSLISLELGLESDQL
jgi:hypothetical protein